MLRPHPMRWRVSTERRLAAAAAAVFLFLLAVGQPTAGVQPGENHLQPLSGGEFNDDQDSHAAEFRGTRWWRERHDDGETDREEQERDANTVRALLAMLDGTDYELLAGEGGHYGNLSVGCSSRCSLADHEAADCWLSTLAYFEGVLVGLMRRFVTVTTNVAMWQHKHGIKLDFEAMVAETVGRLEAMTMTRVVDKNRPLSHGELRKIVGVLVHDVQSKTEAILTGREDIPRTLDCPRACEKHIGVLLWLPMHWLFALSCAITTALVAFIVGAIVVLDRRESTLERIAAADEQKAFAPSNASSHAA